MKTWGYGATAGWAIFAFLGGQTGALAAIVGWRPNVLGSLLATPYDGVLVTTFLLISNPIMIAIVALAVRLARRSFFDYVGLVWPQQRWVAVGIVLLVSLIAVSDALLYLSGRDLVTSFQVQSYASAAAAGWLTPMFVAAVVVAPAAEEIMFRGFLFRGWVRSDRAAWPAITAISALWATLHIQYDWAGVLQIFVIGLFLGFMRWRSGSTLLAFLLHALFNLEGTLETVLQIKLFSETLLLIEPSLSSRLLWPAL